VKSCAFLVAKHHLRDPDLIPGVVRELDRRKVVVCGRVETKPRVVPHVTQIHTQRIVLYRIAAHTIDYVNCSKLLSTSIINLHCAAKKEAAKLTAVTPSNLKTFLANVNSLYAVARPSVCMSVVCLSVTFVRPTQAVQIFGNISTALGTMAIR